MLAAKNSRKRIEARSPAATTRAGSAGELIATNWRESGMARLKSLRL
jgi:hypothetical protein